MEQDVGQMSYTKRSNVLIILFPLIFSFAEVSNHTVMFNSDGDVIEL